VPEWGVGAGRWRGLLAWAKLIAMSLLRIVVPVFLLALALTSAKSPSAESLVRPLPAVASAPGLEVEPQTSGLEVEPLAPGLWLLSGGGDGNVLVLSGDDGTVLIDSRAPATAAELVAAVDALDLAPVRWVINTHYHEDHRGANAHYAERGALVISHGEARRLMQLEEKIEILGWSVNAAPNEALPSLTTTSPMTLHAAGHTLRLQPLPAGHTSSDMAVFIEDLNVLHTGDQFELSGYPFLDIWHGGSLGGLINGVSALLEIADDDTVIVPGHGPSSNRETLQGYRTMLVGVSEMIDEAVADGLDVEQLQASSPTAPWDDRWGGAQSGRRFAAIAFLEATGQR